MNIYEARNPQGVRVFINLVNALESKDDRIAFTSTPDFSRFVSRRDLKKQGYTFHPCTCQWCTK